MSMDNINTVIMLYQIVALFTNMKIIWNIQEIMLYILHIFRIKLGQASTGDNDVK